MQRQSVFVSLAFSLFVLTPVMGARLSDLPDEKTKAEQIKKTQKEEPEPYTPEEKKRLVEELVDYHYGLGVTALNESRLEEAKENFEKVLSLTPANARAKSHMRAINKQLEERAVKRERPAEPKREAAPRKPVKETPVVKQPTEQAPVIDTKKSDDLYLEALKAIQKKQKAKALAFCKRALQLNPDNLQAHRMMQRLSK